MTTVLVTGANRGIGLEFVRQYSAQGANLIACCRNPADAAQLSGLAAEPERKISVQTLDVMDHDSIDLVSGNLGAEAIDILINNAGISGPDAQSVAEIDYEGWDEAMRTNVFGPLKVSLAFLDHVARSGEKKIVTISSGLGSTAGNGGNRYAYRSSKAAVNNVMKGLSADLSGRGISVAIVHPGWVQTDMGGRNAAVTPKDSVAGMREVINSMSTANTGLFVDYLGKPVPW